MDFLEVMHSYFRGERIEALFYIVPAGLLLLGMAATAVVTDRGGFGWGLALPLAVFGLVALGTGAAVGLRIPGQVAEIEQAYREDPGAMVGKELPRMQAVNANWPRLITTWATLVILGLALRFAVKADWAHGVGPALILVGALGFFIDGFAERRARPYTAALEAVKRQHPSGASP